MQLKMKRKRNYIDELKEIFFNGIDNKKQKIWFFFISPYTDVNTKRSTHSQNISVIDGIRGLAVLIVLASHTNSFGMYGQGSVGVLLFYFLSGFVLTLPYIGYSYKMLDVKFFIKFIINRALRILPIYIVIAWFTAIYLEKGYKWYLWNVTLLKGWNHFWSVAQEARFYILFPLVLFILAVIKKKQAKIAILIFLIILSYIFRELHQVDMMNGRNIGFYFYMFLGGCLTCQLIDYPLINKVSNKKKFENIMKIAAVFILLFIFISSDKMVNQFWSPLLPLFKSGLRLNGWSIPLIWLMLFVILFLSLMKFRSGVVYNLLNHYFFRHIGLLSYSIYLSHVVILIWLKKLGFRQEGLFLSLLIICYIQALASYVLIEKPFIQLKPKEKKLIYKKDL